MKNFPSTVPSVKGKGSKLVSTGPMPSPLHTRSLTTPTQYGGSNGTSQSQAFPREKAKSL